MIAILSVTSVLVAEPPAKAIVSPSGPYATTTELGELELNLVVDPALAGTNDIHIYLLKPTGQPVDVAEVKLAARFAARASGHSASRRSASHRATTRSTAPASPFPAIGSSGLTHAEASSRRSPPRCPSRSERTPDNGLRRRQARFGRAEAAERNVRRAVLAVALVALLWIPAAYAHGGGVPGYVSTVTALQPAPAGVTVTVEDGDDRLQLSSSGQDEVVVLGYDQEPYLRFDPNGSVYRNANSEATYVNSDRYGQTPVPASANPDGAPDWKQVSTDGSYEWHDHRIASSMSPIGPPQVRNAPDQPHHVFDWEVQALADGQPFVIAGTLDYMPPDNGTIWLYVAAPVAALALVALVLLWRIRRRRMG